ncbi:nitroreductase family protein [Methanobrevibacter sp.]|uniref:nitroreductase family protein n=1 Tax=Methanobrevibacter sp. TaxID=66852 RepID=UPI00388E4031
MDLASQIYKRKSARKYLDDEIDMSAIREFLDNVKVLTPEISYSYKILTKDEVSLKTRWSAPYYLALYSQKKENYGVNLGFIFQQASLFMQSLDIGSCWVGMASVKEKNPEFEILIAFGKSDDCTRDIAKFKRKKLSEISDVEDEKLKPAQLAPSAINSQPWYFKHTDEGYDVYKVKHNIVKRKILGKWNDIDVGIALSHLYVSNKETFKFEFKNKEDIKGYSYIGSLKI